MHKLRRIGHVDLPFRSATPPGPFLRLLRATSFWGDYSARHLHRGRHHGDTATSSCCGSPDRRAVLLPVVAAPGERLRRRWPVYRRQQLSQGPLSTPWRTRVRRPLTRSGPDYWNLLAGRPHGSPRRRQHQLQRSVLWTSGWTCGPFVRSTSPCSTTEVIGLGINRAYSQRGPTHSLRPKRRHPMGQGFTSTLWVSKPWCVPATLVVAACNHPGSQALTPTASRQALHDLGDVLEADPADVADQHRDAPILDEAEPWP